MNKYVSLDKRSKKAQREYHAKQRRTWGGIMAQLSRQKIEVFIMN